MAHFLQSVAEWCFFKSHHEAQAYYRRLRDLGYAGAEMVAPQRVQIARDAGLRLVNISASSRLNRLEHHPESLATIRTAIGTARGDGVEQVIVFSGNRAGLDDASGIRNCIAGLKQVAGDAERAGILLTFEVFNTFDHPDYQADNSAFAFEVIRGVDSPAVKVLYDLYHMHRMGEDVASVVCENLPLIGHLHVAGSPKRDYPGPAQAMDYASIVKQIHAAGYRGFWGQEFLPQREPLDELADVRRLFESFIAA